MRWSKYFLQTVREVPGDAEAVSHVLLARAGMIRRLAAGKPEEAKAAFNKAKTVTRGGALEDRMLHQVRSNIRLVEKFGAKKKESAPSPRKS